MFSFLVGSFPISGYFKSDFLPLDHIWGWGQGDQKSSFQILPMFWLSTLTALIFGRPQVKITPPIWNRVDKLTFTFSCITFGIFICIINNVLFANLLCISILHQITNLNLKFLENYLLFHWKTLRYQVYHNNSLHI